MCQLTSRRVQVYGMFSETPKTKQPNESSSGFDIFL